MSDAVGHSESVGSVWISVGGRARIRDGRMDPGAARYAAREQPLHSEPRPRVPQAVDDRVEGRVGIHQHSGHVVREHGFLWRPTRNTLLFRTLQK